MSDISPLVTDDQFISALDAIPGLDEVAELFAAADAPAEPDDLGTDDSDPSATDLEGGGESDAPEMTPALETADSAPAEPQIEEGEEGPPLASPSSDITSDGIVAAWRDTFGTEPTAQDVLSAASLVRDLNSLSPHQRAQLQQILNPAAPQTQAQPDQSPLSPPADPVGADFPAPPTIALPDYTEPEIVAAFEAQQQYLSAIAAQATQAAERAAAAEALIAQQQVAAQTADLTAAAQAARQTFRESHPELTADDLLRIEQAAAQSAIYPQLVNQYGDYTQAAAALLDISLAQIPDIRDRVTEARIADAVAASERKARAGAVSGASTASPRRPVAKMTGQDLDAAALEEVRNGALDAI